MNAADLKLLLQKAMNEQLDLFMLYRDFYGQVTTRMISPISWVTDEKFLAYCHLRKAERHFRLYNVVI